MTSSSGNISALLALCEFPWQRPVTRSFDVIFYLCLNKWLSKQSCGWWFETPLRSLWRHCNGIIIVNKRATATKQSTTKPRAYFMGYTNYTCLLHFILTVRPRRLLERLTSPRNHPIVIPLIQMDHNYAVLLADKNKHSLFTLNYLPKPH